MARKFQFAIDRGGTFTVRGKANKIFFQKLTKKK